MIHTLKTGTLSILTGIFLIGSPLFAQEKLSGITTFVEQEMSRWNIPNLSMAIVDDDGILMQCNFGREHPNSNFLIGSVAKTFTALSVIQLYEKGALDIDRPVVEYLPWFQLRTPNLTNRITVRHLLNQTSGLPKKAGFFLPETEVQAELEQQYKHYLQSLEVKEAAIGKEHIYCNLNYQILGELIREVSGVPYGAYVRQNLFEPLGMDNSYANFEQATEAGLIPGYQYFFGFPVQKSFFYNNNILGAGDITSNVEDMSKLLIALLNRGVLDQDTIVSAERLQMMQAPVSNRYGMGFSIGPWNGLHSIRHSGLSKNYSSAINILPEKNYGIVILTNVNSFYAVRKLMDGVIRRLNNQERTSYTPYEMYFRYLILVLMIWSFVDVIRKVMQWHHQHYQVTFSRTPKIIFAFVFNAVMSAAWLVVVPYFMKVPLLAIPVLQPDLGYSLFIGVFLGVGSAVIKYFLKSNLLMSEG